MKSIRPTESPRQVETETLLEEMERLQLRAEMLLAEHRHVVATMTVLRSKLDATQRGSS
ncbi:MAG: hypothetical protein QOD26_2945 [Betaproteobacteria bacterium]|jgi:hypothetical protein|nr:hypothetical protein [Betaproteobacteria bacterium]